MEVTLEQALQNGVKAHKSGQIQEADRYYTAILKVEPKHPDANHNMGVLAVGVGKLKEALPFFKTALDVNPNIDQFWFSYLDVLIRLDRLKDAELLLKQAKDHGLSVEALNRLRGMLSKKNKQTTRFATVVNPPQTQVQSLLDLFSGGEFKKVISNSEALLTKFPNSINLYNLIGASNESLGNLDQAIEAYQKAINIKPDLMELYTNLANAYLKQNKVLETIEVCKQALSIKPNHAVTYHNLGNAFRLQGKFTAAIEAYEKSLTIKPDYAESLNNLGVIFHERGEHEKAVEFYLKALLHKSDYVDAHFNLGNAFKDQNKLEDAIEAYKKATTKKPDFADAYYNMGIVFQNLSKYHEAIISYEKAITIRKEYINAYNNLGVVLKETGHLEEAVKVYYQALSLNPKNYIIRNNLGLTLKNLGEFEKAIVEIQKVISIKPDYAEAYNNLGGAFKASGEVDKAKHAYREAIKYKPDFAEVHYSLSLIHTYTANDPHFHELKALYSQKVFGGKSECSVNFALAKMYEDLGDLENSFKHLSRGNALRKELHQYLIDRDKSLFTKLKQVQPNLIKSALKRDQISEDIIPIFIIGMPRSGTTLVEQIISSHSEVSGLGELNYVSQFGAALATGALPSSSLAISEFRNTYLAELARLSKGKYFATDKLPHNFRFIPLICSAFPEAKIIHVQRDKAATCWSNFKHNFVSNDLGYACDLKDTLEYYELYEDLMQVWNLEHGKRIHKLVYEELTTDQEGTTKHLINYLGLDWEDNCLAPQKNKRGVRTASQQQVRRRIYTGSSEAWKQYERFIGNVFDQL